MVLLLALALLPLLVEAGDRAFKVRNECAYTVWPAVANYPTGTSTLYTGTKAWEAAPGTEQDITIPAAWNGRIWARLDCTRNDDKLSCKFGGELASSWEPPDMGMGNTNLFEINLTGDMDWWDISAVPGFGTPISVSNTDVSCPTVECTTDLNPTCPSVLAVQGDDGSTIGCLSACNAKINADTPSLNCCSGIYDNRTLCTKDKIDYYDFYKNGCTHAYAFPFDDKTGEPDVVYTCDAAKESGYTITFCPGGSRSSGTTTSTLAEATTTGADNFVLLADSTGTSSSGAATSSAESSSGHSTSVITSASSHVDQIISGGSGATATGGTTVAVSKTSSSAASASSSSSSDTTDDGTILGLSKVAFGAAVGAVLLIAVAGVLLCVCMGRKKQAYVAPSSQVQAQAQPTTAAASLAHRRFSRRSSASATYDESSSGASSGEGEMNSSDEERELMREIRNTRSTDRSARRGRV